MDELVSTFALKFNLRRYSMGVDGRIAGGGGLELTLAEAPKRQGKAKSITDQLLGSFF